MAVGDGGSEQRNGSIWKKEIIMMFERYMEGLKYEWLDFGGKKTKESPVTGVGMRSGI